VTLLLNIKRKRGDTPASGHLVRRFVEHFSRRNWPGTSRPAVFYHPRALDQDGPGGVLHSKALLTDCESVLITSANLTEAALDQNIKLGLLVRDHALAATAPSDFQILTNH